MVWDAQQRGLALRVWPSGRRSWYLVYRRHGRPRWYHIGAADAVGLADARKLAAETMLDVIRGRDPAAEKRAARGTGTFGELASRYVEEHAKNEEQELAAGGLSRASVSATGVGQAKRPVDRAKRCARRCREDR